MANEKFLMHRVSEVYKNLRMWYERKCGKLFNTGCCIARVNTMSETNRDFADNERKKGFEHSQDSGKKYILRFVRYFWAFLGFHSTAKVYIIDIRLFNTYMYIFIYIY